MSQGGAAVSSLESQRKVDLGDRFRGLAQEKLPLPTAALVASLLGPLSTGGKHKARGPNPALHLVLSGPAPCFYLAAAPSFLPLVKEQLHFYGPKVTFHPLKATVRLKWPPVKMSLTPPLAFR